MLQSVFLDFFEDLAIGIRSGDLLLDIGGIKLPFVFQLIKQFGATFRIDDPDLLALVQKDAVHAYIGLDRHHVVVNKVAFPYSPLIFVAIDDFFEISLRVRSRRSGQPNLDGVEVVEGFSPD